MNVDAWKTLTIFSRTILASGRPTEKKPKSNPAMGDKVVIATKAATTTPIRLTEAALAKYDAAMRDCEPNQDERPRIQRLRTAARELGFDLPDSDFVRER
jgi:hypothetical protein